MRNDGFGPATGLQPLGADGSYTLPLTHEQARLWFLSQTDPTNISYHMAYRITLDGQLDEAALIGAINSVVERHEPLRTRYIDVDGEPRQCVRPRSHQRLERIDLSALPPAARLNELQEFEAALVRHPFDLSAGELMRMRLARLSSDEHCLIVVMHHIIGDGWSHAVLVRDLCAYYSQLRGEAAETPAPLPIQYGDYAVWQQQFHRTAECAEHVRYWVEQLRTAGEPLRLIRDSDATSHDHSGGSVLFEATAECADHLRRLIAARGWLSSAVLLTVFEAALARFTDQDEFPIGLVTANRAHEQTADLVGFFVNTLAMPSDADASLTFEQAVVRVQRRLVDSHPHQAAPFALVAANANATGRWGEQPLVRALFVLQNAPQPRFTAGGLRVRVERVHTGTSKFELSLMVTERDGVLSMELEYDARLFARSSIESFRDLFVDLLDASLRDPAVPLGALRFDEGQRRSVPSVVRGAHRPELAEHSVPALIAGAARRFAQNTAIEAGDRVLTYAGLQTAIEAYAATLAARGIGRGDLVALALPRSAELVVAMLAVLTRGAAYMPIGCDARPEHMSRLIARAGARGVVLGGRMAPSATDAIVLPPPTLDDREVPVRSGQVSPSDLAYVMPTSGSTGEPKFVQVEHGGLANVCRWIAEALALTPGDRCLFKTPPSFDASARELYPVLISGGALIVADADAHRDMTLLRGALWKSSATVLHCVPSQLEGLMADGPLPPTLRAVMCGGELLRAGTAEQFRRREGAQLWNVYGPTEATVDATALLVNSECRGDRVPIGRPIANMTTSVVDRIGAPVPRGAVGEICLRGIGVARGYTGAGAGDASTTPFGVDPVTGERTYRTGDRGRIRPDGTLEFLGRSDRQLKRHGVRIEPAAIERAILEHPAVGSAHVVTAAIDGGAHRLVAFVAPASHHHVDRDAAPPTNWEAVFETSFADMPIDVDARTNTQGWIDSTHRWPIPADEVCAAADEAAARILRWGPRRILELGCGAGLLLARLAPNCEHYHGVDFARTALDSASRHVERLGLRSVTLTHASILDFDPGDTFDAIVLNSVVQYLPTAAALAELLARLSARLAPGAFFFLGDVRDGRLVDAAALERAIAKLGDVEAGVAVLTAHVDRARDSELCFDPAFFARWQQERSGASFQPPLVEVKACRGDNELVAFRFDVTLVKRDDTHSAHHRQCVKASARYPHGRAWRALDRARRISAAQPHVRVSGLSRQDADGATPSAGLRLPCDVLDAAALDRQHVLLLACSEVGWFEAIQLPKLSASDTAAAFGWSDVTPPTANAPGQFQRFVAATSELGEWLREQLPSYLQPDRLVFLPAMPLTVHGKTHVAQLEAFARHALASKPSASTEPPLDEWESEICDAFRATVGVDFSRHDDFFLSGGHSLVATLARARLSQAFGVDVPLRLLFEAPTAKALGPKIRALIDASTAPVSVVPRRGNTAAAMASFAQRRLWFIEQLGTAGTVYNVSHAMRVDGPLDLDALDRAVGDLVSRHAPLRSRFPECDGAPAVIVDAPRARGHLTLIGERLSMKAMALRVVADAGRPFDLGRDPLLRVLVGALDVPAEQEPAHLIALVAHHIVCDGWSIAVALSELSASYQRHTAGTADTLPPLQIDYYDVAAWQHAEAASGRLEAHIRYWLDTLQDAPARLSLAHDHPAPTRRTWRGDKLVFEVPDTVTSQVRAVAARTHSTLFMVLLAAYQVLLHKMSGVTDFVVGTVIANRNRAELESLIGFLVNPLALRASLAPGDTFATVVSRVRERALSAFEHQDAPFEMVLERLAVDRRTDYQAVFQVLFAMQNAGPAEATLAGTPCTRVRLPSAGAMFDLSLEMKDLGAVIHAELEFSTDLFRESTARLIRDRFLWVLDAMSSAPDSAIDGISLLPSPELALVQRFSRGEPLLADADDTMPRRLWMHAMHHGAQIAIRDGDRTLSFGELAITVAAMAARLRDAGVVRGDLVGMHLPRGIDVAIASFGVQFLGATPVYVDPEWPLQRRRDIVHSIGVRVSVGGTHAPSLECAVVPVATCDAARGAVRLDDPALVPQTTPDDIAFATFTSGSSGIPKAVLVSQRAICLRLRANDRVLSPLSAADRVAHVYSFNYDGGLVTLFWPLTRGATLVFLPLTLLGDARRLAEALSEQRITVLDAIPTVLQELFAVPLTDRFATLRLVVTGGDVCPPELPAQVLAAADVTFANQYGPCEAVVNATTWSSDRRSSGIAATIGTPIPGADIFVVDAQDNFSAIGIPGEILIGGDALASGYLGAPDLTADKFRPLTIANGSRVYRSGDVGRWRIDGELEFLGRVDRQVQVRGMRTDPGEIEATIVACPGVDSCFVTADGPGERVAFTAYVVPAPAVSDALAEQARECDRVREWRELFDVLFEKPAALPLHDESNYAGWDDTATAQPIPREEMVRWRNATLQRIRSRPLGRVLEVGAGLGLIALPLSREAASYIATDASPAAVEHLRAIAASRGLANLSAHCVSADEIARVGGEFDLIVLNSVVQYFPSAAFLSRTLEACGRLLAKDGNIFVGDVRDARLARLLHYEVAAARCGASATTSQIRRVAAESERQHEELQVAPSFFDGIADGRGGSFTALPLLKVAAGRSEMARYRYDVWLSRSIPVSIPEFVVPWSDGGAWRRELAAALAQADDCVRLSSVPSGRFAAALQLISAHAIDASDNHWLRVRGRSGGTAGVEPDALLDLVPAGRHFFATPAASGEPTCFDGWFLKASPGVGPTPRVTIPLAEVDATVPMFGRRTAQLRVEILRHVAERLAAHMRPQRYLFVDRLPTRPGAKIDVAALRRLGEADDQPDSGGSCADTALAAMADLWRAVVDCDEIAAESDFFDLGGHSLAAARLTAAVRRDFGVDLPVLRVFELRTLVAITSEVAALRAVSCGAGPAPIVSWRSAVAEPKLTATQCAILARLDALPLGRQRHLAFSVAVDRALDPVALSEACAALAQAHPMLGRRIRRDGTLTQTGSVFVERASAESVTATALRPIDVESEGPFALALVSSSPRILIVRAHPAFFDGDSIRIALADLAAAYRSLLDHQAPLADVIPSDYAALAEIQPAGRCSSGAPGRAAPGRASPGRADVELRSTSCRLTNQEVTSLDNAARRIGVTPCALLLGHFAMEAKRLTDDGRVECPVSTRAALDAERVIGPFAVDAMATFAASDLAALPDAALAAASRIGEMLSGRGIESDAQASSAPVAFSYQQRVGSWNVPGLRVPSRPTVLATPQWVNLKIAVDRRARDLEVRVSYDASAFDAAAANGVIGSLRRILAESSTR